MDTQEDILTSISGCFGRLMTVAIVASTAATGNCKSGSPVDPNDVWDVVASRQVLAGGLVEGELAMTAGGHVDVDFTATAALDWNVHSHGATVVHHVQGRDAATRFGFTATAGGAYYLMWQSNAEGPTTVDVRIRLNGNRFVRWIP
jgi:hypothetical protein